MNPLSAEPPRSEQEVDEAIAESFPASDSPAWNPTRAGPPVRPPGPAGPHQEAQRQILIHLDLLGRRFEPGHRIEAREKLVAQAILEMGGAVVHEPVESAGGPRNLESEVLGVERDAPCVVVGARYDAEDVSRLAVFLAVERALLAGSPPGRTVRFVAFADSPSQSGPLRYADRLRARGQRVHAMISIGTLGLANKPASVVFAFGWRHWSLGSLAGKAFRRASSVRARVLPFAWWPGLYASDYVALGRRGWPAIMVADFPAGRRASEPNLDRMAAAIAGIVASVQELADRPSRTVVPSLASFG